MRRFMVRLVTEIDFVDGEDVSNAVVQNYQKHLSDTLRDAAQHSLRTIKGSGSRPSRSQKSRMNLMRGFEPTTLANMRERRSHRHRGLRELRSFR